MGKKRSLAGKLKHARALHIAEQDARLEGKERLAVADGFARQRVELMRSIQDGIRSGLATTNVPAIDDEIEYLDDITLDPPPPEPQRDWPDQFFRPI